jgi:hypothetical protein
MPRLIITRLRSSIMRSMGAGTPLCKHAGVFIGLLILSSVKVCPDSVAREALRCHLFGGRAMFRKVVAAGRVETDTGIKLPNGSRLALPKSTHAYGRRHIREPTQAAADAGADSTTANTLSFVSTFPDFLAFSHGKHACPGRLLVDFELKMIIAYVLTHYDIRFPKEYGGQWPANRWMAEVVIPLRGVFGDGR